MGDEQPKKEQELIAELEAKLRDVRRKLENLRLSFRGMLFEWEDRGQLSRSDLDEITDWVRRKVQHMIDVVEDV